MTGRRSVLIAALALAGCSEEGRPAPAAECTAGAAAVVRALGDAPGEVRLADGTALSECVRNTESDAELQNLGIVLTDAAEDLEAAAPEDPQAALKLGYLIGAARRGAPSESALQAELVRRLERSAALAPEATTPAARRAVQAGMKAGEARG